MLPESFITLLQWLLPTGGIGTLLGWLVSSRLRRMREEKEEHESYRLMYHEAMDDFNQLRNEKRQLEREIAELKEDVASLLAFIRQLAAHRNPLSRMARIFLQRYESNRKERDLTTATFSDGEGGQHLPRDSNLSDDGEGGGRYSEDDPDDGSAQETSPDGYL